MPNASSNLAERAWIQLLRARLKSLERRKKGTGIPSLRLAVGDDCAVLAPPSGHEIAVTTDFSLETVHFQRDWQPPESVGHRCLARGLSDIAAMGARPVAAFLSLALPLELVRGSKARPSWRDRFFDGFLALAEKHHVPLAGGDTAQSPRISWKPRNVHPATGLALADIVLIGSAPRGRALLRSTAKPGDRIYVTGHLGGAVAELAQLAASPWRFRDCTADNTASASAFSLHPHLFPEPRIAVGAWLLKNHCATAAIDISDGLSTDLDHLCEESGLSATIDAARLPIHPLARESARKDSKDALALALDGGEDYELLFTSAPQTKIPRRIAGVPVSCIGTMRRSRRAAPRMTLVEQSEKGRRQERPLVPGGWEHYA